MDFLGKLINYYHILLNMTMDFEPWLRIRFVDTNLLFYFSFGNRLYLCIPIFMII